MNRAPLLVGVAVALLAPSSPAGQPWRHTAALIGVPRGNPGQLGGPYAARSVGDVIALLAKNGAATLSSERSRAPLDRVGSPTGLEFTREQVTSMVMGAADGDGIRGSALDAADAVPKNKRVPPVSYLLAAWVATAASSGAAAVRRLMGPQD